MLTKSKIMAGLQCPKRLWLQVHRKDLAAPIDSPAIRQGNEVDKVAQQIFPGGVLIDGATLDESLALTTRTMTQPTPHIYQATVAAEQVLIKADILSRAPDGWVLTEVKAATKVKPEYLPDVAVQAWVLRRAGVAVTRVQLAHVDTDFVYPGNGEYDGLLEGRGSDRRGHRAGAPSGRMDRAVSPGVGRPGANMRRRVALQQSRPLRVRGPLRPVQGERSAPGRAPAHRRHEACRMAAARNP